MVKIHPYNIVIISVFACSFVDVKIFLNNIAFIIEILETLRWILCHLFSFLVRKVGPLAAYYQVPLRHILLVSIVYCYLDLRSD